MSNTDKQLAELLVEEKKLLEQQKKEQGALKQKLRAVKRNRQIQARSKSIRWVPMGRRKGRLFHTATVPLE